MFHPLRSLLLRRSPNLLLLPSSVRHASQLTYTEHGTPCEVLKLTHREPGTDSGVLVEMRLSPVNPADINTIQGKYPITPPLPAVGGGEGVGVVREVKGQGVKGLQVGDWVIPSGNMKGTWTTHMEGEEQDFIKVKLSIF